MGAVILAVVLAACGSSARPPEMTPPVAATPGVPDTAAPITTAPPLVITIPSGAGPDDASQSPEEAARDGVVPELAALARPLRLNPLEPTFGQTSIEAPEGVWVISSPSPDIPDLLRGCLLGDANGVYGRDVICVAEYAEVLLLDPATGEIERAYPFPSVAPQLLELTDDAVYCVRQGDGGLPDSMMCRIDRSTLAATMRVFPFVTDSVFGPGSDHFVPTNWTIDEPTDLVLWQRLDITDVGFEISGLSGSARVDPGSLALSNIVEVR